ncbi:MAG TPA: APC family permease [Frankiaceae bacterium]|jgi:amino acid transporter|nr:APC family permease [Frankiaceae bacterium]
MRRDVGLVGLTFTSLGCVIGSGWLLAALEASSAAGPAAILAWGIGGVIVLALALVYAEIGAAYPVAGGTSRVPHIAFGPIAGFASGWLAWLGSVTLAPIEVEAALQYLTPKIHAVTLTHTKGDAVVLTAAGFGVGAVLLLLFATINVLGVRKLSESNTTIVSWKILVPLLTVVALVVTSFHSSNFAAGSAGGFMPFGWKGVLTALPLGVVFSLTGFEQAVQLGAESRNPGRDMPRAVIGSVIIGILLYLALQVAFLGALSPSAISHGWASPIGSGDYGPFATIATTIGLGWLAVLLYIDAVVSPGGTGLIYVGTSSRAAYTMARSGYAPKPFAKIGKRGVPFAGIALSFVVGLIMFLPFPGWQKLVSFISSASALMFAFAPVSLAVLRRSDPERKRPYRMPYAKVLAPASFAAATLIVYWGGWETTWKLLVAIGIGFAVFTLNQLRKGGIKREDLDLRTLSWLAPYLIGLLVLTFYGQFKGGRADLPFGIDLAIVAVFALVVYAFAVRQGAPSKMVERYLAEDTGQDPSEPASASK